VKLEEWVLEKGRTSSQPSWRPQEQRVIPWQTRSLYKPHAMNMNDNMADTPTLA